MKRLLFSLAAIAFFGLAASAQLTFTLSTDTLRIDPSAAQYDTFIVIVLTNTSATAKTVKWERTVPQITAGCKTQICDPNACYLASISSKQFTLEGNSTAKMQVHFLNPTAQLACATVSLKMYEVGNVANTVTATYLFNDCAILLDEDEARAAKINLFPNPAATAFTLENADNVSFVQIYNMDGRLVRQFDSVPGEAFFIGDLAAGNYVAVLQDKARRALRSVELKKN